MRLTFRELSARTLGVNVSWQEAAQLAAEADRVMVCFRVRRGRQEIGQAMEIPKTALINRADWAFAHYPEELVNVFACAGTLYFGGTP